MPRLLAGLRVLIVEDELLAALEMRDMIEDRGGAVVGPTGQLDEAFRLVQSARPDAAVLDVKLNGTTSYLLADELVSQGVPVIFVTGYAADRLPDRFAALPILAKPVTRARLERAFRQVIRDL